MKNDATDAQCRAGKIIERKRDQRQFWFYPAWPLTKPSRHAASDGRRNFREEHVSGLCRLNYSNWGGVSPSPSWISSRVARKLDHVGTRSDALPSGTSWYDPSISTVAPAALSARARNQYPMVVSKKALHKGPRRANRDSEMLFNNNMQKKAKPITPAG